MARPLVLWGFHPAHGNIPLKLEAYTKGALERRKREGWTCAAYAEGDDPVGLKLQANAAKKMVTQTVMGAAKKKELSPYDRWMVKSNLKRISEEGADPAQLVATLKQNGYLRVAEAVESALKEQASSNPAAIGPTTLGDLKLGAAKTCPPGFILRKAYVTKAGVEVGRGCVPDQGKKGKTPPSGQTLPKPEPGGLKGWSHEAGTAERHAALKKASAKDGCGTTLKRLNLLANFTKTTSPATHRAARRDMQWLKGQGFCSLKKR
jgi:hypothetical protein